MTDVRAEMTAAVFQVHVQPGDVVDADTALVTLESMKMEIPVLAGCAGVVSSLEVAQGAQIDEGALIAVISTT